MTDTTSGVPPLAIRTIAAITAVVGAVQLAAAVVGRDYWFDEVYLLAIGRSHLDWGSADQPPVAPALAALSDTLVSDSLVVLRIPVILATMCAVVVAALIAREMGCDGRGAGHRFVGGSQWPLAHSVHPGAGQLAGAGAVVGALDTAA